MKTSILKKSMKPKRAMRKEDNGFFRCMGCGKYIHLTDVKHAYLCGAIIDKKPSSESGRITA